ncbi:hypothetical protein [Methylobacterium mesophilicum]
MASFAMVLGDEPRVYQVEAVSAAGGGGDGPEPFSLAEPYRWVSCPKGTTEFHTFDGSSGFNPPPDAPPQTRFDFLGFMGLFTQDEQGKIVSSDNVQIKLFCLMAAGAAFVDLTDQRVIDGANALESLGLIGKGRAAQVTAGKAPPKS